jgi:hypothetical protein
MNNMIRTLICLTIISTILSSGCVSETKESVSPDDVIVDVAPIIIKEYEEQEIRLNVQNNATESIDNVKATSFEPFTIIESKSISIPGRKDGPQTAAVTVKILAPAFNSIIENPAITLSYNSGKDEKGNPVTNTKQVPVQTTVLPNASLQFVGFVKGLENITEAEVTTWTLGKGENATITFSVKNMGKTTIDGNMLKVLVDVENKRIGSNKSIFIEEAMARGGTSYTEGLIVPVLDDAPNGETDVSVILLMGDHILDSRTLLLKVKL